jgi:hypothetical protein
MTVPKEFRPIIGQRELVENNLPMSDLRFLGHDLIFVSTKPAAGQRNDFLGRSPIWATSIWGILVC